MIEAKINGMFLLAENSVVNIHAGSGSSVSVIVNSDHTGSIPSEKSVAESANAIKSACVALIAFCKCLWRLIYG